MIINDSKTFNDNFNIQEVIETILGERVNPKKYCTCPICGGERGGISITKNYFSCWNNHCTEGGAKPYRLLEVYLSKVKGISDWRLRLKEIDRMFKTNLYKEFKRGPKEEDKLEEIYYTKTLKVDKYCSEIEFEFFNELLKNERVLLKAGTGFGKSHMLANEVKKYVDDNIIEVDKVIFATARGSIVEEIGNKGFDTFYKNDVQLPYNKYIATTTHKSPLLVQQLDESPIELQNGEIGWEPPKDYLLIIDECHLLLTNREIVVKENKDLRRLKELIDKAKYVVFTSANTNDFYHATKDIYNIKSYINVERREPLNNLERLEIKRITDDKAIRNEILLEDMSKEVANGNKVFLVHNNIKELQAMELELKARGILASTLYSANKTSEEVIDKYNALIKKSILKSDVTLCTSVVDTGVNILDNKVTTMLVQDQLGFDDITTIQTFARVRVSDNSFSGNKGILYLTDIKNREERHDILQDITWYKEDALKVAEALEYSFNRHMYNNYDWESYECYKDVWGLLRNNEQYEANRKLLFLECHGDYNEEPKLVVDTIATYDKARRRCLRANYFNDKFIERVAKEINTKQIIFTKDLREKEDKDKPSDVETYQDVLLKFMEDEEYYDIIMGRYVQDVKLEEEPFIIGYLKGDYGSKFNKLDKRLKTFCHMIRRTKVDISQLDYITSMIEAHALLKGKNLLSRVREIEYPIYNLMYTTPKSYEGLGDQVYELIRANFDKAMYNRNKINNNVYKLFMIDYIKTLESKKYYYDAKDKLIKTITKDKPINEDKKRLEMEALVNLVYEVSDKGYLKLQKNIKTYN